MELLVTAHNEKSLVASFQKSKEETIVLNDFCTANRKPFHPRLEENFWYNVALFIGIEGYHKLF